MLTTEQYPMLLKSDGSRARPWQVEPLTNGLWRVDWIGGLVSLYRDDPRAHLRLGYDPKHLAHLPGSLRSVRGTWRVARAGLQPGTR